MGRRRGRVLPAAHEPRGLRAAQDAVRELAGGFGARHALAEVTTLSRALRFGTFGWWLATWRFRRRDSVDVDVAVDIAYVDALCARVLTLSGTSVSLGGSVGFS